MSQEADKHGSKSSPKATEQSKRVSFVVVDEALFTVYGSTGLVGGVITLLPLIPQHLQPVFTRLFHHSKTGMHSGVSRTLSVLRTRFAWPHMRKTVQAVVATCVACQRMRMTMRQLGSPMLPLPRDGPWHTIGMDIFGPLPTASNGARFVLVMIDHFTKWPIAVALKQVTTAEVVDQLFQLINNYGCPTQLLTDRGPQFASQFVRALCVKLGVRKVFTTAYYPQGDGIAEAFMRVLKHNLAVLMQSEPHHWPSSLPAMLFAYRNTPHPTTGDTPFRLLFGYDAKWPSDVALQELTEQRVPRIVVHDWLYRRLSALRTARCIAWRTMTLCYERAESHRDSSENRTLRYEMGQLVWLQASSYERSKAASPKMAVKFVGPYRVVQVCSNGKSYRLMHIVSGHSTTANASNTKPFLALHRDEIGKAVVHLQELPRMPDPPI
eukprot:GHVS01108628.1.p1 GENE.GHVS01108628.1~~GHVS01108628.1.p1  ORF type:complete len:437 (+),score=7.59 GHVS01108628.1:852-2162(+)